MKTKTKKIFSLSVLVLCIAVFGLVGAVSAQIEPSIDTILDGRYGTGCWQITTVETFLANGGSSGMTATAIVVDSQCGYTNPTGWYVGGSPTDKTELWWNPNPGDPTETISTGGSFGLYIDSNAGGNQVGPTYYTETSLNPSEDGASRQHAKVYQITGGTSCKPAAATADYVVAFEDQPYSIWDEDYNDVVIELRDTSAIPEFASIAIPAIAVLGLFLYFNRRKQRKE